MLSCAKSVGHPVPSPISILHKTAPPPLSVARQLAMPTMTSRTTLGPFALLYYTRIIFKSQLGSAYSLPPPLQPSPLACTAERGWKNNFENLFSLILIRCKSFAFPLCPICISERAQGVGGEIRHRECGGWQIITFSDLASSSLFNYLPRLVANFHFEQQPGEHN